MKLKFFGTECQIGTAPVLNRLGQTIEVSEDEGRALIAGNGCGGGPSLLPAEDFDAIFDATDEKLGFFGVDQNKIVRAAKRLAGLRGGE